MIIDLVKTLIQREKVYTDYEGVEEDGCDSLRNKT